MANQPVMPAAPRLGSGSFQVPLRSPPRRLPTTNVSGHAVPSFSSLSAPDLPAIQPAPSLNNSLPPLPPLHFTPVPPPTTSIFGPLPSIPLLPPPSSLPTQSMTGPSASIAQPPAAPFTMIKISGPRDYSKNPLPPGPPMPRRMKIPKGKLMEWMMSGNADKFVYPVPAPVAAPLTPRPPQKLVRYDPDGTPRFVPFKSSPNANRTLFSTSDFMPSSQPVDDADPQFTCFNKLPLEIRLRIWELGLPSDRIIKINKRDVISSSLANMHIAIHEDGLPRGTLNVICKYPGMLGACAESRKVALGRYKLSFATRLGNRPIFFDKERDIMFFEDTHALNQFTGYPFERDTEICKLHPDLASIKHIIIGNGVTVFTSQLLGLYDGLSTITFQQQVVSTPMGPSRMRNREGMIFADLGAPKEDGGAGRHGCLIRFVPALLLRMIAWNPAWRAGMLDK